MYIHKISCETDTIPICIVEWQEDMANVYLLSSHVGKTLSLGFTKRQSGGAAAAKQAVTRGAHGLLYHCWYLFTETHGFQTVGPTLCAELYSSKSYQFPSTLVHLLLIPISKPPHLTLNLLCKVNDIENRSEWLLRFGGNNIMLPRRHLQDRLYTASWVHSKKCLIMIEARRPSESVGQSRSPAEREIDFRGMVRI